LCAKKLIWFSFLPASWRIVSFFIKEKRKEKREQ
jgi:hypothetical protein